MNIILIRCVRSLIEIELGQCLVNISFWRNIPISCVEGEEETCNAVAAISHHKHWIIRATEQNNVKYVRRLLFWHLVICTNLIMQLYRHRYRAKLSLFICYIQVISDSELRKYILLTNTILSLSERCPHYRTSHMWLFSLLLAIACLNKYLPSYLIHCPSFTKLKVDTRLPLFVLSSCIGFFLCQLQEAT